MTEIDIDAPAMTKRECVSEAMVQIRCMDTQAESVLGKQMNQEKRQIALLLLEAVLGIKG